MTRHRLMHTRDALPAGWTLERWDTTKAAIREVIWARAAIDRPIGYEELSQELLLNGIVVGHRSPPMTGLLNDLAVEVHKDAKCWVTTWVVWAGTERSSNGLFDYVVPEREWKHMSRPEFCRRQRELAKAWILAHPRS